MGSNCRFVRSSVLTACIFALVSVPIADAVHAQSPKQANTTTRATAKSKAKSPWESVVVLGASASAGFNPTTFAKGVSVAQALDELIKEEHKVTDASDYMFFVSPSRTGAKLIKKAEAAKPSLVVALDFLFWYAYGKKPTEQRFKDLDAGFKLLERFDCPIVITRLPDMSPAIGKMLSAEQVPAKDVLGKLNKSLEAWSKKQKNIVVAPLVKFLDDARDGKAIKIGQAEWPKGSKKLLLHADELHPTTEGVVALAYLALHELDQAHKGTLCKHFSQDLKSVVEKLTKALNKSKKKKAG